LVVKVNIIVPALGTIDGARLLQVHYEYDITNPLQGIVA
jgi:hypothetical protein